MSSSVAGGAGARAPAARPLGVLTLSTVYPSSRLPHHGLFVRRRLASVPGIEARVVAPAPWFPGTAELRPGLRPRLPRCEVVDGELVERPRFVSVPGALKGLDALSLFLTVWPLARRLHRARRFDVVDAHFVYPEGVAAVLLGRALGLPVVVTLRGVLGQVLEQPTRRPQAAWALRRAERVIALSESLRVMAARLGRDASSIGVIPNAVDPALFPLGDRAAARQRLGLAATGPLLLFVGTPSRRKGLDRVLAAMAVLSDRWPDVRLAIVGAAGAEASAEPELRRQAARAGLDARIAFVGPRAPQQLADWYNAADLFVLASRLEGSSNAALEALACGTPLLATPVGELPEVVTASAGGVLAPLDGDLAPALATALARTWDRASLRAWVLRRSWSAVGAAVAEQLHGAVADARSARPRLAVLAAGGAR